MNFLSRLKNSLETGFIITPTKTAAIIVPSRTPRSSPLAVKEIIAAITTTEQSKPILQT